jgi:phosphoribosylaminoimidazolecarboxamide formyltransferase/IMP cyclohydrolase
MIKRALLSVSDKEGLVPLAEFLHKKGVSLISTGGTAKAIADAGLPVTLVSDVTKFPEIMNGRVKSLHPSIHGGLLCVRDNEEHMKSAKDLGIEMIDLVVVNLYPFEETVSKSDVTLEEAIENIDIGGPSMLRSAAKNYRSVCVLTDPADYADFEAQFKEGSGTVSSEFRATCAKKVFALTARYDSAISTFLQTYDNDSLAESLHLNFTRGLELRYGENPHQSASLYTVSGQEKAYGVAAGKLLNGKALSYNNLVDIEAAWNLVQEFPQPACSVIKHTNPCGCAIGSDAINAFEKAWAGDPVSAFGSIIAFNRKVDVGTANAIVSLIWMQAL